MDPVVTVIGDLVASRSHPDRTDLQRTLGETLDSVNRQLRPAQPFQATVGDEFQGVFETIAPAARAVLIIRLRLLDEPANTDVRFGLGFGLITVFDLRATVTSQDGAGWWSARASIEEAKRRAATPRLRNVRSAFGTWPDKPAMTIGEVSAIDALLMSRDDMVSRMKPRERRLLLGILMGEQQADLARRERISAPAVSKNLHRSGALMIEATQRRLEGQAP